MLSVHRIVVNDAFCVSNLAAYDRRVTKIDTKHRREEPAPLRWLYGFTTDQSSAGL
jgi:hypothetical protein